MFGFKEVDVLGLEQLQEGSGCLLIDVRTEAEVARGGIGGGVHIPLHLLPLKVDELPKDKPIVFYCQSGGRSAQACAFVASKGWNEVYNLQGGIMAWMRAGKPLVSI
ncbi:MAG: rhodanese-like domain-containing protein [Betaproteobacteria bacterium]|nr:rhodanese-like domain-containing protein [Betaproteobacteria bacterium]